MSGRLAGEGYPPSKQMAMAANQGIDLFSKFERGGTKRRLELGQKIARGEPLMEREWRSIASFHARNWGTDNPESLNDYPDGGPDARYIASLLLGGDSGFEEAVDLIPKLNTN